MNPDPNTLMLIVVGAHLRAELTDRPLGDRFRDICQNWMDEHLDLHEDALQPVVCTDLWYLNHEALHGRPVVAIGEPDINAASAYLGSRIPTAFVIDDTLRIHADLDFVDLRACMWGVNNGATVSAVDLFAERYLDGWLRSAHNLPPSQ